MKPAGPSHSWAVPQMAFAACALLISCGASDRSTDPPQNKTKVAAPAVAAASVPRSEAIGGIQYIGKLVQGGWLRGSAPPDTRLVKLDGAPLKVAPDGAFFVAFDRDAPPAVNLAVISADGFSLSVPLTIAPRRWHIESINVAKLPGKIPAADFKEQRTAELAQIRAARAKGSVAGGWRQTMIWPTAGRISGEFGAQRIYRGEPGAYHTGLDLAAPIGAEIRAPADGVVVLAATDETFTLEGHLLIVDHGMGLASAFLHCSDLLVRAGDSVALGQLLGHVGMTGRATGPHLHWALTWNGRRLDPRLFAPPKG